jgi:hypothetical protein
MRGLLGGIVAGLVATGCVVVSGPPGHVKHGRGVIMGPVVPVVVAAAPRMIFVSEFGVSFAPDLDVELYEVGGVWYSFNSGGWYRGRGYDGPWVVVDRGHLPGHLVKIKPGQVRRYYKEHGEGKGKGHGKGRRHDD